MKFDVESPELTSDPGMLTVCVEELTLQLKMSAITCLSDFAEDEKLAEFLPMKLKLQNLFLVLEVG